MVTIKNLTEELESFAPLPFQEDYDNSGLLCGSDAWEVKGVLLTLDCTVEVVEEAITNNCNVIIAHHPLIFGGIKKLSGNGYVQQALVKAIKNDIAIYACHTNIDNVEQGVNAKIAEKLGLNDTRVLLPKTGLLRKLVTYVPLTHYNQVLNSLFENGAGKIGNYDSCSFTVEGKGTFRGNSDSEPFIGKPGELMRENEIRLETVFPAHLERKIISALLATHPYEEVAYDIFKLENTWSKVGSGLVGELSSEMTEEEFLNLIKTTFKGATLKYTPNNKKIQRVAVCGGSGKFLLAHAISSGADAFITADFKYHEFFDAVGKILVVDTGHFENEQFTPELFSEIIKKKFSTFAVRLSEIITNPVKYF